MLSSPVLVVVLKGTLNKTRELEARAEFQLLAMVSRGLVPKKSALNSVEILRFKPLAGRLSHLPIVATLLKFGEAEAGCVLVVVCLQDRRVKVNKALRNKLFITNIIGPIE